MKSALQEKNIRLKEPVFQASAVFRRKNQLDFALPQSASFPILKIGYRIIVGLLLLQVVGAIGCNQEHRCLIRVKGPMSSEIDYRSVQILELNEVPSPKQIEKCVDQLLSQLDNHPSSDLFTGTKIHKDVRRKIEKIFAEQLTNKFSRLRLYPSAINKLIKNKMSWDLGFKSDTDYFYIANDAKGSYFLFSPFPIRDHEERLMNRSQEIRMTHETLFRWKSNTLSLYVTRLTREDFPFSLNQGDSSVLFNLSGINRKYQLPVPQDYPLLRWGDSQGRDQRGFQILFFRGDGTFFGRKVLGELYQKIEQRGFRLAEPERKFSGWESVKKKFEQEFGEADFIVKQHHAGGNQAVLKLPQEATLYVYRRGMIRIAFLEPAVKVPNREIDSREMAYLFQRRWLRYKERQLILDGSCYSAATFHRYFNSLAYFSKKYSTQMAPFVIGGNFRQHPSEVHNIFLFLLDTMLPMAGGEEKVWKGNRQFQDEAVTIRTLWPQLEKLQFPEHKYSLEHSGKLGDFLDIQANSLVAMPGVILRRQKSLVGNHSEQKQKKMRLKKNIDPEFLRWQKFLSQRETGNNIGVRDLPEFFLDYSLVDMTNLFHLDQNGKNIGRAFLSTGKESSLVEIWIGNDRNRKNAPQAKYRYIFNEVLPFIKISVDGKYLYSLYGTRELVWDLTMIREPKYLSN